MTHHETGQLGLHEHSYDSRFAIDKRFVIFTGDEHGRGWLARSSYTHVEYGIAEWQRRRDLGEIVRLTDTQVGLNQEGLVIRSTEATGSSPSAPRASQADALTRHREGIVDPVGTLKAIRAWSVRVAPSATGEEMEQLKRILNTANVPGIEVEL